MLSDSISLRGAPLLSSLSERGARASCLELYGAKGFIIAGRVRKGCNHPNYLISDTKVKRYRMSPRSPTIISRLTPCLFSDVNLIDKKKIRNCIYYIEKAFCRFISFYTTLNATFSKCINIYDLWGILVCIFYKIRFYFDSTSSVFWWTLYCITSNAINASQVNVHYLKWSKIKQNFILCWGHLMI